MQKLKPWFDRLRRVLPEGVSDVVLNGCQPRVRHVVGFYGGREGFSRKGVKSDFVRLLRIGEVSVGFAFSFAGKDESSWTARVSIREEGFVPGVFGYRSTENLDMVSFRKRLSDFVVAMERGDQGDPVSVLSETFGLGTSKRPPSRSERRLARRASSGRNQPAR